MTHRTPIAAAALASGVLLAASACGPRPERTPLEPMGRLPNLVTTAEPEWLPFQVAAGARLPLDPREPRLSEPRAIPVGGAARRVAWSTDGKSLLVEVRPDGAACDEAWDVPLDRRAPKRVSGANTRARIGAYVGPGKAVIAESACAEPSASAKWAIVEIDVGSNARRTLARPDGEAFGVTSDGRFAYFASRSAPKKERIDRVALAGGSAGTVADCVAADVGTVALGRFVYACGETNGSVQLMTASEEGGYASSWSGGRQVDLEPSLSPDGQTLVFASSRAASKKNKVATEGPFQIYVAPYAKREIASDIPERLTFAGESNRAPALGPNGFIAWVSDRAAPGGPLGVVVARYEAP